MRMTPRTKRNDSNLLTLIADSKALNPELFSLTRMEIMSSLMELGRDGSTFRELKAVLGISDGALYSNLKKLEVMGYVELEKVEVERKELLSCNMTEEGTRVWNETKKWLKGMLECGAKNDR